LSRLIVRWMHRPSTEDEDCTDSETSDSFDDRRSLELSLDGFTEYSDTAALCHDSQYELTIMPIATERVSYWERRIPTDVLQSLIVDLFAQAGLLIVLYYFWPAWWLFLISPGFFAPFVGVIAVALHLVFLLVWTSADLPPSSVFLMSLLFATSRVCLLLALLFFVPRATTCGIHVYVMNVSGIVIGLVFRSGLVAVVRRYVDHSRRCVVWSCLVIGSIVSVSLTGMCAYVVYLQIPCTSSLSLLFYTKLLIRHGFIFLVVPLSLPTKVQSRWVHILGMQRLQLWLLFWQYV